MGKYISRLVSDISQIGHEVSTASRASCDAGAALAPSATPATTFTAACRTSRAPAIAAAALEDLATAAVASVEAAPGSRSLQPTTSANTTLAAPDTTNMARDPPVAAHSHVSKTGATPCPTLPETLTSPQYQPSSLAPTRSSRMREAVGQACTVPKHGFSAARQTLAAMCFVSTSKGNSRTLGASNARGQTPHQPLQHSLQCPKGCECFEALTGRHQHCCHPTQKQS